MTGGADLAGGDERVEPGAAAVAGAYWAVPWRVAGSWPLLDNDAIIEESSWRSARGFHQAGWTGLIRRRHGAVRALGGVLHDLAP